MDQRRWMLRKGLALTFSLGVAATALAISGCGGSSGKGAQNATTASTQTTSATTASDDDDTADGIRDHHRHHHGGVAEILSLSVSTLGVSPDEATQIAKIQSDLDARMAPARDAQKALISAIADGVAAGAIDKTKVDAALAQVASAAGAAHDASLDAVNQLHAVLSPVERATLVDKMDANFQIWRHVNSDEQPESYKVGSRLQTLADEVGLTPDQVLTISVALHNATPDSAAIDTNTVDAYMRSFRSGFTNPNFDAKSFASGTTTSTQMAKAGGSRMVRFYEAVAPVLTPDQRPKVAGQLPDRLTPSPPSSVGPGNGGSS